MVQGVTAKGAKGAKGYCIAWFIGRSYC